MSLESWKKEFYPKTAASMTKSSWLACVEHSILKWEGLQRKNLKKHAIVRVLAGNIRSQNLSDDTDMVLTIDTYSCALCCKAFKHYPLTCEKCSLYIARGKRECSDRLNEEKMSPWVAWCSLNDPKPMQRWLRKTKKMLEKND